MTTEVTDIEIVMHLFRLARSGNYKTVKALLVAVAIDYPDVPKERLERCAAELAKRITRHG
jgi:hypothetical protein